MYTIAEISLNEEVQLMTLDLSYVGKSGTPKEFQWNSRDAMLYAVAVGAGMKDTPGELAFTTENTPGLKQKVLPSMVCVLGNAPNPPGFELDPKKLLHAEQSFSLSGELPVDGRGTAQTTITGIYDKGQAALVTTETVLRDATGAEFARRGNALFIRGEGGFGGERGPRAIWELPARQPDAVVETETRPEQALLYRLTGDRNPLHTSPEFAKAAGFDRPILHGMCTYGFTARILLHEFADSNPSQFAGMSGRFTRSVHPGERLRIEAWKESDHVKFRTLNGLREVVIDHGIVTIR